ncbi:MAG: terminase small subunit [Boseongicola sp.]
MPNINRLSERETAYCRAYLVGASGAEAARMAGYSPKGAGVASTRLLKRPRVIAEIGRLNAKTDVAVNDLLTNAVTHDSETMPPPKVMEGELIDPVKGEAVAVLSRAWVIFRHMRSVQIAMGEIEVVEKTEVIAADGRKTKTTIRKTTHDPVAAHQHLKSLAAELDRRDANLALAAKDDNPATTRAVDLTKLVEPFTVMRAPKGKAKN